MMSRTRTTLALALVSAAGLATPVMAQTDTGMSDPNRDTRTNQATERNQVTTERTEISASTNADYRLTRWLEGRDVLNASNQTVAEVSDLLIDRGSGRIEFAILKTGTTLGMGGKTVAVPYNQLQWDAGREKFVLNTTVEQLKTYPEFSTRAWTGGMASTPADRSQFGYDTSRPATQETRTTQETRFTTNQARMDSQDRRWNTTDSSRQPAQHANQVSSTGTSGQNPSAAWSRDSETHYTRTQTQRDAENRLDTQSSRHAYDNRTAHERRDTYGQRDARDVSNDRYVSERRDSYEHRRSDDRRALVEPAGRGFAGDAPARNNEWPLLTGGSPSEWEDRSFRSTSADNTRVQQTTYRESERREYQPSAYERRDYDSRAQYDNRQSDQYRTQTQTTRINDDRSGYERRDYDSRQAGKEPMVHQWPHHNEPVAQGQVTTEFRDGQASHYTTPGSTGTQYTQTTRTEQQTTQQWPHAGEPNMRASDFPGSQDMSRQDLNRQDTNRQQVARQDTTMRQDTIRQDAGTRDQQANAYEANPLHRWMYSQDVMGNPAWKDPYDSGLDLSQTGRVEGTVKSIERTYADRHGEQTVLVVTANDGSSRRVILGPSWYSGGTSVMPMRGDTVVVHTVTPRELDADRSLVATSVQVKGRDTIEYRSREGQAMWSSPSITQSGKQYPAPYYRYVLAEDVRGKRLDCRATECGKVEDLIVDVRTGMIRFASIDPDRNFLGIGDSKRLVPWSVVSVGLDGTMRLDANKDMILASPMTPSDLSQLNDPSRTTTIYGAYQVNAPNDYWSNRR